MRGPIVDQQDARAGAGVLQASPEGGRRCGCCSLTERSGRNRRADETNIEDYQVEEYQRPDIFEAAARLSRQPRRVPGVYKRYISTRPISRPNRRRRALSIHQMEKPFEGLIFYEVLFFVPSILFALRLQLPPFRTSDPLLIVWSHSGHSCPLPTTVSALIFIARKARLFSPRQLALKCVYTVHTPNRRFLQIFFPHNKKNPRARSNSRP